MLIMDIFHTRDQLQDLLEDHPSFKGVHAEVYDLGAYVLKVFGKDKGYTLFLDFIKEYSNQEGSEHLPKIEDHLVLEGLHLVLIEKLDSIQDENVSSRQDEAEAQGWYDMDINPWLGISNTFDKVLYALEDYVGNTMDSQLVEWDLHANNIMERNGILVITDPWS